MHQASTRIVLRFARLQTAFVWAAPSPNLAVVKQNETVAAFGLIPTP